jgi:RNA polymerase sigma factor (sigma-70 family)
MSPPVPHDDDRCARLYQACKGPCVGFARRLLLARGYGNNRYLLAYDAEEFYDLAWQTYYDRREYLEERDQGDHIAYLNRLVLSRVLDAWRRATAQRRGALRGSVDIDRAEHVTTGLGLTTDGTDDRIADQDELRWLLSHVRNPADARALVDHEVHGLTYEEIGEREGISAEAARRRAQRAAQQARARREPDR